MSFAEIWMKLETITLSKLTQKQQTNTETANQTLYVLTHKWELNNENTWTQGGERHTVEPAGGWEDRGGLALGEIPNVDDGGMETVNHHGMCVPM